MAKPTSVGVGVGVEVGVGVTGAGVGVGVSVSLTGGLVTWLSPPPEQAVKNKITTQRNAVKTSLFAKILLVLTGITYLPYNYCNFLLKTVIG